MAHCPFRSSARSGARLRISLRSARCVDFARLLSESAVPSDRRSSQRELGVRDAKKPVTPPPKGARSAADNVLRRRRPQVNQGRTAGPVPVLLLAQRTASCAMSGWTWPGQVHASFGEQAHGSVALATVQESARPLARSPQCPLNQQVNLNCLSNRCALDHTSFERDDHDVR